MVDPQMMAQLLQYQKMFGQHPQPQMPPPTQAPGGIGPALNSAVGGAVSPGLLQALIARKKAQQLKQLQPVQVTAQKLPMPQGVPSPDGGGDSSGALPTE